MELELINWSIDGLNNLVRYANNFKIASNLADAFPHPYTKEDGLKFIEKVSQDKPTKIFAISFKSEVVGSIGIFPDTDIHRKNAAIAYWIAEQYWGKGIATAAILNIIEYGFNAFDIERIYAKPFETNIASRRVLVKAGLKLEARFENTIFKNGQFLDELVYGIWRHEFMKHIMT